MDIKLPKLGEGADKGTVVSILVKTGDRVERDQNLIELENEKAVAPIPSPEAGTVTKVHVTEGQEISVGALIVTLDGAAGSETAGGQAAAPKAKAAEIQEPVEEVAATETEAASSDAPEVDEPEAELPELAGRAVPSSPTIRKLVRDLGIDLRRVRGSERGGRVVLADLKAYIQKLQKLAFAPKKTAPAPAAAATAPKPAPESIDFSRWGEVEIKPMTALRKTVSRRLGEAWNAIPHVTQFDEADITALLALKKKFDPVYAKAGVKLTVTSFVLRAIVTALEKYPIFNTSLDEAGGNIVFKKYVHLGVAVDTEQGLIVPVLRDANQKSVFQLTRELEELAARTRDRKISGDDLKGGTFTLSNLGGIGGTHFTPIVNRPEVAILGVGRGAKKPVVTEQGIEPRVLLPLGLSYDHRVIDGADGARFIRELVAVLQDFPESALQP